MFTITIFGFMQVIEGNCPNPLYETTPIQCVSQMKIILLRPLGRVWSIFNKISQFKFYCTKKKTKRFISMVRTEHHPVTYSVHSMPFWLPPASVWHRSHQFYNQSCTDIGKHDTHARAAISIGPAKFRRALCTCEKLISSGLIVTSNHSNGSWICCRNWKSNRPNWAVPWNGKWVHWSKRNSRGMD